MTTKRDWFAEKRRRNLESRKKKVVGKPYEGKPHVRFEVAGAGNGLDNNTAPVLDPTNFSNDYQEFIFFWSGKNCLVENNTVLRILPKNSVTDVVFSFQYSGNIIRNNIFVVNGGRQVFSNNGTETWKIPSL